MTKRLKGIGQTLRGFMVTDINSKGQAGCRVYGMTPGQGWQYHAVFETNTKSVRTSITLRQNKTLYFRVMDAASVLGYTLDHRQFSASNYEIDIN